MRNPSKVIWRTVVCAALAPACHHGTTAPPAPPDPAEEPPDESASDGCVEDLIFPEDPSVPPGDTTDGKVILHITSTPSGAQVWVDDEDGPRGVTPIDLELEVQEYRQALSVSLDGYETAGGSFYLGEDLDQAGHFDLIETSHPRPRCVDEPHFDIGFVVA